MPASISTYGPLVDRVFIVILIGAACVAVFAFSFVIYTLVRFHHSRNPVAQRSVGKASRLMYLVGFMILFDLTIAIVSGEAWGEVFLQSREDLIKNGNSDYIDIQVVGRQFFWTFLYPGADNKFNSNDDFALGDSLVVPANTLVNLTISSGDVIHSFFVPVLRLKYDAIPGRQIQTWFKATKEGSYEILCAELCGDSHFMMRAKLDVVSKEEYSKFVKDHSNRYE